MKEYIEREAAKNLMERALDDDWVSLQYNNACISIENMMEAASIERAEEDE